MVNSGKIYSALLWAYTAVALDGRFVPNSTLLGKILWKKKQYRETLYQWEEAARIDPENVEIQTITERARKEIQNIRKGRLLVRSIITG